ncbi:unnamed protein product [Leptidea sinapis]|uniref:Uncharacterized protein n=1 Tax=Leptidea sinapis TaxID=189913 RepID=A0A5E4QCP1_9NEOP|nr:unnamed protein product [Leptidea sinapis]
MQPILCILLALLASSTAHYRGYEDRNLIERDEPNISDGTLVECPVCENTSWLPSREQCNIVKGNKRYKKCERGTYVNEVCGNRLDCYRGPNEQCTEKMDFDVYGQKCGHGYYCDRTLHVCTGLGYTIDSKIRLLLNDLQGFRYPLHPNLDEDSPQKSMLLLA